MKPDTVLLLEKGELERIRRKWPCIFPKGPHRWAGRAGVGIILLVLFVAGLIVLDFSIVTLLKGTSKLFDALAFMLPPSSGGYFHVYFKAILETVAMAFLGSLLSSIAAVPLGFLGAKNIVSNIVIHLGLRRMFDFVRALDPLVWALIFVNAVGLGPLAGILAIAVNDTGTLSKLFAEAIETADYEQIKGVKATGANPVQVVAFGYMPQIIPVMLSNSLFFFEANVRSATILGIVGAGGIGMYLADRLRVLEWQQASFIILSILVTVVIIDHISRLLRRKFIGNASFS
jgi:phosphonate transport system permease protein